MGCRPANCSEHTISLNQSPPTQSSMEKFKPSFDPHIIRSFYFVCPCSKCHHIIYLLTYIFIFLRIYIFTVISLLIPVILTPYFIPLKHVRHIIYIFINIIQFPDTHVYNIIICVPVCVCVFYSLKVPRPMHYIFI